MKNNEHQSIWKKYKFQNWKRNQSFHPKKADIAIIGMACRFPGAENYEEFWELLKNGKSSIQEIPLERWDWRDFWGDPQTEKNKINCKWGGFIKDFDAFDPGFFNLSAREVETMDPQQRIMLELSWSCLEDAAICPSTLSGQKVGVFIGTAILDYKELQERKFQAIETHYATGIAHSVIPSRISFYYNFKGPSFPLDAACASSLYAIHSAIQALQLGECNMAMAGGVNLLLTPPRYISFAKMGLLSSTGSCKTFDDSADGIVRGEGAGLLLLKPLDKALEDGDAIYGILKGSAINHSGKTHTLTYPNPEAQAEVISEAFRQAEVTPDSISYIETHGTGTPKGDPIEFDGLIRAFRGFSPQNGQKIKRSYCGLSSVKTNIGHLESAAGMAGVIKILLAMKHKQLLGLQNFKRLNHRISIENTPFYIVDRLQEWKPLKGQNNQLLPRRAGVSAFGFAGTNAHVVLEEAPANIRPKSRKHYCYLICLSAKTEEALQQREQDLARWLEKKGRRENDMIDISATLLLGREHFKIRVAYVVKDIQELQRKLKDALEKKPVEGYFKGYFPDRRKQMQPFYEETGHNIVKELRENKNIGEDEYIKRLLVLGELYVNGYNLDWEAIFVDCKISRVNLPTYPFAKEHYWIPEAATTTTNNNGLTVKPDIADFIHPLVHQNTSNLFEHRYSSTFTGQEFFFIDHIIKGKRIMLRAALLEMIRAAVERSLGTLKESQLGIQLKNIIWTHPIIVSSQPVQIHIRLFTEENGEIAYEVFSESENFEAESPIYSQGIAVLCPVKKAPIIDLKTIREQSNRSFLSSNQCYEALRTMGVDYTTGIQGIEMMYLGKSQVLAKISLSSSISGALAQIILHPNLIDSSLQASVGLMIKSDTTPQENKAKLRPLLPVSLQELDIFNDCPPIMWALIRYNNVACENESETEDAARILDIDLCDEQGEIFVQLKGIKVVAATESETNLELDASMQKTPESKTQDTFETIEMMTFEEVWQEQALLETAPMSIKNMVCFLSDEENQQAFVNAMRAIDQQTQLTFISQSNAYQKYSKQAYGISCADRNMYENAFRGIMEDFKEIDAIVYLWAIEDTRFIQDYSSIVYILQAIASAKIKPKRLLLVSPVKTELDRCYLDSWIGFERSLGFVLPNTQVAVISQETETQDQKINMKDWLPKIWAELHTPKAQSVLYQSGKRHVCRIQPTTIQSGKKLLKSGGTYLITGGCGGLGLLFAERFAKIHPVNLILTGRSPIDAVKESKIKTLEALGSRVLYVQADICDPAGMSEGLERIKARFGRINGVIHAAGVHESQSVLEKEFPIFQKVLDPKIKGTLALDELLCEEELDFICYFSSSSAILGDFGCADYAIGNRFLMAYAHFRNQLQHQGKRKGKTFVINWPLWKDGGMGFDNMEITKMYLKSSGQRFLEAEEGLAMFESILSQESIQHLVLVGERSRVRRFLGLIDQTATLSSDVSSPVSKGRPREMAGFSLEQCLEWDLKNQISKLLKISRDKLNIDSNLADFGFDSISLAEFATVLTKHFDIEITPSLFFGFPTLKKLSQYFLTEHHLAMQEFYSEDTFVAELPISQKNPANTGISKRIVFKKSNLSLKSISQTDYDPIAIIGMSGRFPDARNIDEMWQLLLEGRDTVRELPEERTLGLGFGKENWKCGCIPGVREFDPLFFEISPREAENMDPRQRLLLEESWKALEDAGYGTTQIRTNKIGMFVGVEEGDYHLLLKDKSNLLSNHNAILAARLSYFLNLNGPNMAINTACSSGLVAAHQAILSLRNNECDTAIAAGVNLLLTPKMFVAMREGGMLSEDGKCFSFDTRANGMVPGEAIAVVVFKRLSQAKADGDPVYAIIQGSGINYDGKTNGITAPSGVSQTSLLKAVYDQYKVNPEEIEYIVTHGTGTKLGDPVEINALYDVFKNYTKKQGYCALTSTKPNFGHTLAASGLVSLISLVQALRHETIPASLNCERENDYIQWKESPFYVNKHNRPWTGATRIGAISAFGISGTNAHMVVKNYTKENDSLSLEKPPYFLLVLSAKTQEALLEKVKDIAVTFQSKENQAESLLQVSYTLMEGRQHFNHRCAIVIQDRDDAIVSWKRIEEKEKSPNLFLGKVPRDFTGTKAIEYYIEDLVKQSSSFYNNRTKYQEMLCALADLYCQGYEIPWNEMFGDIKPQRVHLPAYPFAKENYWVPEDETKNYGLISQETSISSHPLKTEKVILTKEWRLKPLETKTEIQAGVVVVLGTTATGNLTLELFKDNKAIQVLPVTHGETSACEGITADFYSNTAGDYFYQKIKELQNGQRLLGVIDVTACDKIYEQSVNPEFGKICFLQKLLELDRHDSFKLLQVTYQLNDFLIEKTTMQGARLAGLYRMLSAEYRQIQSMTMDSDYSIKQYKKLAEQIQKEFLNIDKENLTECCYRNNERYQPLLVVSQSDRDIRGYLDISEKYEEDKVILITGGSRGIGAALAQNVVSQGAKKLVIMGRENLPKPSEWKRFLENKEKPELEEKLRMMQTLVEQGVKVHYYNTSLTDLQGLKAILQDIHQNLGPVSGVYHCAGISSINPAFIKKTSSDIETVCEPKVKGLATLHEVLEKEPLDFFILFSSISSIAPTLATGQSDYAMANAYMDYYAKKQTGEGKSYFKSVQWPAWGEIGMAAGGTGSPAYLKTGFIPHTTKDGLAFVDITKKMPYPVSIPCVASSEKFVYDQLLKTEVIFEPKIDRDLPRNQQSNERVSPKHSSSADLQKSIIQWIREIFVTELKLNTAQLDEQKPFDEYGIDSIILAQLAQTMQERLGKTVDPALLLEHSTINALADYFVINYMEVFQKNLGTVISNTLETSHEPSCSINTRVDSGNATIFVNQAAVTGDQTVLTKNSAIKEDIAVVGLSCRFPGSPTKEAYWDLLNKGMSAIKPLTGRWSANDNRKDYGGWIEDIDMFDPRFFNISEEDAAIMDPQSRIILEESLKAIYDAGYEHKQLSGERIGVYIGGRSQPNHNTNAVFKAPNPILGIGQNYLATNISRFYNFNGPSLVLDTACSSGLTGISLAADSLRDKRISMALVGAVSLLLNPYAHDMFAARNILSKNGQFHIFDKRSNGEVLGEGAGVVILKRLDDAIKDGNQIYGVIKAIAVNNDGRTLGPGSPNINAQKQVIKEALLLSGKQPEDVGYIEVNGGGSPVIDSIEIKVLSEAYHLDNRALRPCYIGSIKPNIGHLLLGSGLAGFIRCLLSVYQKRIPPFLSALEPFEYYDFSASRIVFNRDTIDWQAPFGKQRVAAQSSFPDGGTNCHVIIEEFIPDDVYRQQLSPKTIPNMVKKRFSLPQTTFYNYTSMSVAGDEKELTGTNASDSNKILKNQPVRDIKQLDKSPLKNIWGEFYE